MDNTDSLAKNLWDYMRLNHKLKKAGCILVLCGDDLRAAELGADLFLKSYAPLLIFSGKKGLRTKHWNKSEAEIFAKLAIDKGVPKDNILLEKESSNTGENIMFTRKLLENKELSPKSFIIIQIPQTERRAYATFLKLWPGKEAIVTSPNTTYKKEKTQRGDILITSLVNNLTKLIVYSKKGWLINQNIPAEVLESYNSLKRMGYGDKIE
ncbi:MAG: YdcF family protein [bacterium]|nr:YdcF family protein [bacterium]